MSKGKRDPRVTAYIAKAAPFARPILTHIRKTVHAACPEVEETLKWGAPSFQFHGTLCMMASFKAHCAFELQHGARVTGTTDKLMDAMGNFGRITSLDDLPTDRALQAMIKKAAKLNASGEKRPRVVKHTKPASVRPPKDLTDALKADAKARATFDAFPPSARRDYVEWISEAKRAETRATRLRTTIEWLREGKKRNWKYERA